MNIDGAMQAQEQFANLDGHRVHYRSFGSGETAMIFLSGWGCDGSLWVNQVPALVPYGRVLLVDLPGHGGSDKPDIPYPLDLFLLLEKPDQVNAALARLAAGL